MKHVDRSGSYVKFIGKKDSRMGHREMRLPFEIRDCPSDMHWDICVEQSMQSEPVSHAT